MQFSSRNFQMAGLGNASPMGSRVNGWGRKGAWSWNGDAGPGDPSETDDDLDEVDAATAPATMTDAPAATTISAAAAAAPITSGQALQAKAELGRMRRALKKWLKYRSINDQVAAGGGDQIPKPVLGRPGVMPPSPAVMALRLAQQRPTYEAQLGQRLFQLLSEVFDSSSLPDPSKPAAAVQLAQIAISGKLPAETSSPGAQGLAAWVWPTVIVVGALAIVAMTAIKSSADDAANQEQIACIEAGKCTDSGFWLKVGAIAVVGWLAWDKMGLGEAVTGIFKKKRRT